MTSLTDALQRLADVDGDVHRTPVSLGATSAVESESHAGVVHGARHRVLLDPLLLALPVCRTFVLAAAGSGVIELALPADAPEQLHRLLVERSGLTLDQATTVVDLTVDALELHLGLHPDPHAGLAEGGHALAQLDLAIADAVADARSGLAEASRLVVAIHPALGGVPELARCLGHLGLAETAALVAATAE
jgi:hypothetical protein